MRRWRRHSVISRWVSFLWQCVVFLSLHHFDAILCRLTMTPRTFSRLPTHQSPSSSCGPFSTFSHRWTLNKIFCLEKLNFSLIRSPPFWCSTPSPTLPTSWCGAWPSLGPPGPMPSTGSASTNKIQSLFWSPCPSVASSVGWVSRSRSLQEKCGTTASNQSSAR